MKAIKTTYHGPTDTRGSRIIADDGDGNRVTVPYPHERSSGADAHSVAALALCVKMGWRGTLIAGGLRDCYVFTFAESDRYESPVTADDERRIHEARLVARGIPVAI